MDDTQQKQFETMHSATEKLQEAINEYTDKRQDSKWDKLYFGFERSSCGTVLLALPTISLGGWAGYYGSSSCYSIGRSMDDSEAKFLQTCFKEWAEQNMETIVKGIISKAESNRDKLKQKYLEMLHDKISKINSL